MAAIANCTECGAVFLPRTDEKTCKACAKSEEELFMVVRSYIRDHPGQNVLEVSKGTGVKLDAVLKQLRQGRFVTGQ
jgi:hypothetical protein